MKRLLIPLMLILSYPAKSQNWIEHYGDQTNINDDKRFYESTQLNDGTYRTVGFNLSEDSGLFVIDQFGQL
ncbi:MAG: hypothetical protein MRY83_10510, partial [Flavobacteriales bacterium]|nr:hypothetical protein [Flavobacteriales bacterium]